MSPTDSRPRASYEIRVQGELDQSWENWFSGWAVTPAYSGGRPATTTLVGSVVDQAALRGMLCKLWDLNLTLLSVRRIEAEGTKERQNG